MGVTSPHYRFSTHDDAFPLTDMAPPHLISFLHAGIASPPLNPNSIIQTYHRHNFTVRVEWEDSTSGADTYTISSDTSSMETVPGSETSAVLTLSYNMVHTLTITATLCGDVSEAVTANITKGQVHALRTCS